MEKWYEYLRQRRQNLLGQVADLKSGLSQDLHNCKDVSDSSLADGESEIAEFEKILTEAGEKF